MARKDIEKYFFDLSDDMDPSGLNRQRYEKYFASLDDKQFYKVMKDFISDTGKNFKIMYPPMVDASPQVKFFTQVAKKRGIELYEYIYMPYLSGSTDKDKAPGSKHKMLIGYFNIKRLMQTVFSKTSTSTTTTDRNMETGQVKDSDKHARVSDVEVVALLAQNQYNTAIEYMNMRADDMHMQRQALNSILTTGEVSLEDLDSDITNKVAVNTMNYYMLASGLVTNLIDTGGMMLPITMREKEEVNNTQSIK